MRHRRYSVTDVTNKMPIYYYILRLNSVQKADRLTLIKKSANTFDVSHGLLGGTEMKQPEKKEK